MVISREVKTRLLKNFHKWRNIELVTVIFSIAGLVIAVVDYEIDLYLDGYAGIVNLHDRKKNPARLITKAIWDREHSPNTRYLKIINLILTLQTICLLLIRQWQKM